MELVSRSQAIASGAKLYFTGVPCPRGHVSTRRVSGSICYQCRKDFGKSAEGRALYRKMAIKRRRRALQIIMEAHGVMGCHYKIHPYMPDELKKRECWGALWIEHPEGCGKKQREECPAPKLIRDLIAGRADPKSVMLLCRLHQIWNNENGAEYLD